MRQNYEVQCDSKHLLIDSFEVNQVSVQIYVLNTKKAVKQYCKDTGMDYSYGLYLFYNPNGRKRQKT